MKSYTLDTNIISYILKGNKKLYNKIKKEINDENLFYMNPISYYEIKRGLLAINSKNKLDKFNQIYENLFEYIDLEKEVLDKAVDLYINLRNEGKIIEDADIFIAAVCLENDLILITNNEQHFDRIEDLKVQNWFHD